MNWEFLSRLFLDYYNIPYLLTFLAYVVHEMLGLRLVLLGAHVGFFVMSITHDHVQGIFWNPLFIALNAYHVIKILWEKRKISLPPEMERIYGEVFSSLSRIEFLELWALGEDRLYQGEPALEEGKIPTVLALILKGTALVTASGVEINRLGHGRFFAEMGFLTGRSASATIEPMGDPLICRVWDYKVLKKVAIKNEILWPKLQGIIGREMAQKIQEQNPGK